MVCAALHCTCMCLLCSILCSHCLATMHSPHFSASSSPPSLSLSQFPSSPPSLYPSLPPSSPNPSLLPFSLLPSLDIATFSSFSSQQFYMVELICMWGFSNNSGSHSSFNFSVILPEVYQSPVALLILYSRNSLPIWHF